MNIDQIRKQHDNYVSAWKNDIVEQVDKVGRKKSDLINLIGRIIEAFDGGQNFFVTMDFYRSSFKQSYLSKDHYDEVLKVLSRVGYDCYMDGTTIKLRSIFNLPDLVLRSKEEKIKKDKFAWVKSCDQPGYLLLVLVLSMLLFLIFAFFYPVFGVLFVLFLVPVFLSEHRLFNKHI